VRAPGHDRMRSLGGIGLAWIEALVRHGPGAVQGMEIGLGDEFAGFIMDCYALDPEGKRIYDHVFLSRPKGTNKSGLASYIAMFEALGPARFLGFAEGGETYEDPFGLGFSYTYEPGEPMGKPVHVPMIRCMATEEGQSGNVYDTIFFNLTDDDCPLSHAIGIDPGRTRVYLPNGGFVVPSTASSAAKDGGKETFGRPPAARPRRGAGQGIPCPSYSTSRICTTRPSSSGCMRRSPGTWSSCAAPPRRPGTSRPPPCSRPARTRSPRPRSAPPS
jgi:hypothetical protein